MKLIDCLNLLPDNLEMIDLSSTSKASKYKTIKDLKATINPLEDGYEIWKGHKNYVATFSGKIQLSYLLGLISPDAKRYLNIIRRIRDDFAHSMEIIDLNTESVTTRCRNLRMEAFPKDMDSPRELFMTASFGIAGLSYGAKG